MSSERNKIIDEKASEIQTKLTEWALETQLLVPGEKIMFSMRIIPSPLVEREPDQEASVFLSMKLEDFFTLARFQAAGVKPQAAYYKITKMWRNRASVDRGDDVPLWMREQPVVRTVGDLIKLGRDGVCRGFGNFGQVTLDKIAKVLAHNDINFF